MRGSRRCGHGWMPAPHWAGTPRRSRPSGCARAAARRGARVAARIAGHSLRSRRRDDRHLRGARPARRRAGARAGGRHRGIRRPPPPAGVRPVPPVARAPRARGGLHLGGESPTDAGVRPGGRGPAGLGRVPHLVGRVLAGGHQGAVAALDLALRGPHRSRVSPAAGCRGQRGEGPGPAAGAGRGDGPGGHRPARRPPWRTTSGSSSSGPKSSGRRAPSTTRVPSPPRTTSKRAPTCSRHGSHWSAIGSSWPRRGRDISPPSGSRPAQRARSHELRTPRFQHVWHPDDIAIPRYRCRSRPAARMAPTPSATSRRPR